MKTNYSKLENFEITYPIDKYIPLDKTLFFDIETTGFTAKSSYLYLIGCVFFTNNAWYIRQWFATTYKEELEILTSFLEFAKNSCFV